MSLRGPLSPITFTVFFFVLSGLACLSAGTTYGQQLLILKKGKVTARFNPGDEMVFVLRNDKQPNRVVLQGIREFYFITAAKDTIQYQNIGKIVFRNPARRKYALSMMATGAALVGVWAVNSLAFDPNSTSMRGLRFVGLMGIAVGAYVYFTADSGVKLKSGTRLKYISFDSPLYR